MPLRVLQLQVTDADLCDVLHLSFNSSSANIPARAWKVLYECKSVRLPASDTLALLHTAVERNHVTMLKRVDAESNSLASLAPEQLHPAILRALVLAWIPRSCVDGTGVGLLLALPAAQQLSADAVVALVNEAREERDMRQLLQLPAAMHITAEQLQPVIQRVLVLDQQCRAAFNPPTGYSDSAGLLMALPAAQQLPADAVVALVHMAMKAQYSYDARQLLQLPAAMHISPGELASILEVATAAQDEVILYRLTRIPAFDHLEPAAAAAALLAVAQEGSMYSLELLLDSKSATGLDVLAPALVQQLRSVEDFNSEPRARLAILLEKATGQRHRLSPVADQAALFCTDALLQMLEAALVHNRSAFERLWPLAAATVQAKQLGQLLRCAATCHNGLFYHVLEIVLGCFQGHHAWSSVSEEDKLAWLLRQALQGGEDCSHYCAAPGAAAVDQEIAARLLEVAAATHQSGNLEALLLLPAAKQLGSLQVEQLLQMAVTAAVNTHAVFADKKSLTSWHSRLGSHTAAAAAHLPLSEQSAVAASRCLSVLFRWHAAAGACVNILSVLLMCNGLVHCG
jgi:hypothetical protein